MSHRMKAVRTFKKTAAESHEGSGGEWRGVEGEKCGERTRKRGKNTGNIEDKDARFYRPVCRLRDCDFALNSNSGAMCAAEVDAGTRWVSHVWRRR